MSKWKWFSIKYSDVEQWSERKLINYSNIVVFLCIKIWKHLYVYMTIVWYMILKYVNKNKYIKQYEW